jgi:hypothetical protein
MGLLVCLSSFAASLTAIAVAAISVDPPHPGDDIGNLGEAFEVVLLAVAVATLLAYAGARGHQAWLKTRLAQAARGGCGAGVLTAAWVLLPAGLVAVAGHALPEALILAIFVVFRTGDLLVPAFATHLVLAFQERRAAAGENAR